MVVTSSLSSALALVLSSLAPLLVLVVMAASGSALPTSLVTDLRHAELFRAAAPAPAPGPLLSASAPGPLTPVRGGGGGVTRAVRAAAPPPPPPPASTVLQQVAGFADMEADTEKAAVAAAAAAGRPKRDLGVDPEQLLALLALWQQQQQLPRHAPALDNQPLAAPLFSKHLGRLPGYEFNDPDDWELSMDNNDIDSDDDGPAVGAWLEAPPFAQSRPSPLFGGPRHSSFFLPALPPPPPPPAAPIGPVAAKRETAWGGLAKEKRFMVARKRQSVRGM